METRFHLNKNKKKIEDSSKNSDSNSVHKKMHYADTKDKLLKVI